MEILDALPEGNCGPCKVPLEDLPVEQQEGARTRMAKFGNDPAGPWAVLSTCYLNGVRQNHVYGRPDSFAGDKRRSDKDAAGNAQTTSSSASITPNTVQENNRPPRIGPASPATTVSDTNDKRQRNIEAARRYRKRKVDQVSGLEDELAATKKELESTKLRLARAEAEVDVLRRMLGHGN